MTLTSIQKNERASYGQHRNRQ